VRTFAADVHSVLISGAMSTADSAARAKKVG
jgi:biopolymer transport protein ExbB